MRRIDRSIRKSLRLFSLTNMGDDVLRTGYVRLTNSSNSSVGEQIALLGKVGKRAEIRPVENDQYMSMKKKHFAVSQEPKRTAVMIGIKKKTYKPIRNHASNIQRAKQKKTDGKKIRGSEDDVTRQLFDLYSRHEYYSLAALERLTNQPKDFLKELLKKYCNYNNAVKKIFENFLSKFEYFRFKASQLRIET